MKVTSVTVVRQKSKYIYRKSPFVNAIIATQIQFSGNTFKDKYSTMAVFRNVYVIETKSEHLARLLFTGKAAFRVHLFDRMLEASHLLTKRKGLLEYLTEVTRLVAEEVSESNEHGDIYKMCPTVIHQLKGNVYFYI